MKKIILSLLALAFATRLFAGEYVLSDFNSDSNGKAYPMLNLYGDIKSSSASVCESPTSSSEKVLHVNTDGWNTFVKFSLPTQYQGAALLKSFQFVEFDIYRSTSMSNDNMQMAVVMTGSANQNLYWDESYPFQDNKGKWEHKKYALSSMDDLTGNAICLGIHLDKAEYYIDNVKLSGEDKAESGNLIWTGSISDSWDDSSANFVDAVSNEATTFSKYNSVAINNDASISIAENISACNVSISKADVSFSGVLNGSGSLKITDGSVTMKNGNNNMEEGTVAQNATIAYGAASINALGGWLSVADKVTVSACLNNTSSSYLNITKPVILKDNATLNIYTSRYSSFSSSLSGKGTVNFYCGGERSFCGTTDNSKISNPVSQADWTKFSGKVNIYPYKNVVSNAGFYGVILTNPRTFTFSNYKNDITNKQFNSTFANAEVLLTQGTTLATTNGNRAARIACLNTAEGSTVRGYYKGDKDCLATYIVGADNKNAVMAGTVYGTAKSKVAIIKEGEGSYSLSANNNTINGGILVTNGSVLFNNDASAAKNNKLSGATGVAASGAVVTVYPNGNIGGNGSIGGSVDLYGSLQPGDGSIGTLTIADFTLSSTPTLYVRPSTTLLFRVNGSSNDCLSVVGNIEYFNKRIDFSESDKTALIKPVISETLIYSPGAEYILIETSAKVGSWNFRVANPDPSKWNVVELSSESGYQVVLRAEPSSNANDVDYDSNSEETYIPVTPEDDIDPDNFKDNGDPTTLREYAERLGKFIGVAVPVYKLNLNDESDPRVKAIYENFNLVVAENEMKIDALQPKEGEFSFGNADLLVSFAQKHKMRVRGHTLVWHSQVPKWMSSDGYANSNKWTRDQAIAVMKTHIKTVLNHFKGKVYEWDVINEMLDDNQSIVSTSPDAFNLRKSVWYNAIGEDYLVIALKYAHEVDPDIKLYINEYGAEEMGDLKSEAYFNLAKHLLAEGAPLDGVGLQTHKDLNLNIEKLRNNMKRYAEIGLNCIITELDLQVDYRENYKYVQAAKYRQAINSMIEADNSPHLIVWGITDDMSWVSNEPLLFDGNVEKKPAFWGARNALSIAVSHLPTPIEEVIIDKPTLPVAPSSGIMYNLMGQRVDKSYKGIVIINGKKYLNF